MEFSRERLKEQAATLAALGVYVGTSSWKYPGWRGMLYDRARYEYRGKFAGRGIDDLQDLSARGLCRNCFVTLSPVLISLGSALS